MNFLSPWAPSRLSSAYFFMSELAPELLAGLQAQDPSALAEFIELRRAPLMAFIQRQLGAQLRRKVEPDDVFQEMSAEAVRALAQADFSSRDPSAGSARLRSGRSLTYTASILTLRNETQPAKCHWQHLPEMSGDMG